MSSHTSPAAANRSLSSLVLRIDDASQTTTIPVLATKTVPVWSCFYSPRRFIVSAQVYAVGTATVRGRGDDGDGVVVDDVSSHLISLCIVFISQRSQVTGNDGGSGETTSVESSLASRVMRLQREGALAVIVIDDGRCGIHFDQYCMWGGNKDEGEYGPTDGVGEGENTGGVGGLE
mmetsp:Transcript_42880/g.52094  ORF Transcript_42880/g.52094 Transcript_42880/m.52094 type:complete len:176 (-) Transcript_42880:799-1326(-)